MSKVCLNCGGCMSHKRKDAMYCCTKCKQTANRDLVSLQTYRNSVQGRSNLINANIRKRDPKTDITKEWITERLNFGKCEVTSLEFKYEARTGEESTTRPWSPSIDRINPNLGYTKSNCQMVVWIYNAAKNIFNHSDVVTLAEAVLNPDSSIKKK